MGKKDFKILIRIVVVIVIIFVGFALIEIVSRPTITARTISPIESETVNCVNVVDMSYKGIEDKDNCCRLIQQTDRCELLDGTINLEYNEGSKTAEPEIVYSANYVCYAGANTKLYFSFDTYEYCELQGYRIILKV